MVSVLIKFSIKYFIINKTCHNFVIICSAELKASIDEQSGSLIKLNNGIILYLREVNKFLALVCILREYNFTRQAVVDYNFLCLHEAIHKIFSIRLPKKTESYNQMNDNYYDQQQVNNDQQVNGSLINGGGGSKQPSTSVHQSNAQLTNYLLNNKFRRIDD